MILTLSLLLYPSRSSSSEAAFSLHFLTSCSIVCFASFRTVSLTSCRPWPIKDLKIALNVVSSFSMIRGICFSKTFSILDSMVSLMLAFDSFLDAKSGGLSTAQLLFEVDFANRCLILISELRDCVVFFLNTKSLWFLSVPCCVDLGIIHSVSLKLFNKFITTTRLKKGSIERSECENFFLQK